MSSIFEEVGSIFENASPHDHKALADLLDAQRPDLDSIVDALWMNCQSTFGYIWGREPTYSKMVEEVAYKLEIEVPKRWKTEDLEKLIGQHVLKTAWEKMDPEQRDEFENQLQEIVLKFNKSGDFVASAGIFAALTGAQLSGFGVYLLASTSLGFLSGAVGVALPFALYTTMSSAIAVIIGPVGWIGAGLFAIWKLSGPNYKKLIPAILYLSALRTGYGKE